MIDIISELSWIASEGGPLILLPQSLLPLWKGCFTSNEAFVQGSSISSVRGDLLEKMETDYDRACAVDEYVGAIAVGPGAGIVFGDEPALTTWIVFQVMGGGVFIRWMYADDERTIPECLKNLADQFWDIEPFTWKVTGEKQILFDATEKGDEVSEFLEINLALGEYEVATCEYKPDKSTFFVLHRLRLLTNAG